MKKAISRLTLAASISLPVIAFPATPTMHSVSGNIETGQVLTISGSNLMDENKSNWHQFFQDNINAYGFEGSSPAADYYNIGNGFHTRLAGSSAGYDAAVKLSGGQAAKFHIEGEHTDTVEHNPVAMGRVNFPSERPEQLYIRGYGRWDLNSGRWPSHYIKMWWLGMESTTAYYQWTGTQDSSLPGRLTAFVRSNAKYYDSPEGQLEDGRWYCFEAQLTSGSNGTGIFKGWVDGKLVFEQIHSDDFYPPNVSFGMVNLNGTEADFDLDNYWDNYAFSENSRVHCSSIIEIGDSPNYATANKNVQPPISLANNSIEFKADLSGLGEGPYYLWVTNNRQERSQAYLLDETNGNTDSDGGDPGVDPNISISFEESFEDSNFASRGWYDITGGTLSSSEHLPASSRSFECRFLAGGTSCVGGAPKRVLFDETDSVYVSYWIKYSTNWTGSNKPYHPHMFYLLTNQNDNWSGLAWTRLTAYIEENEGVPRLLIQDAQNIDVSAIGQNLTNTTEMRAIAGCNGTSDSHGTSDCYQSGSKYYNSKTWDAEQVYFSDTAGPNYKADWHRVEAFFKLNSIVNGKGVADGELKYWYDGELIIDHNNVMMRTAQHPGMKFNQFVLAPWIGDGSPVDQTFWIDNLAIGTGTPGTNISLHAPSNIRVQ